MSPYLVLSKISILHCLWILNFGSPHHIFLENICMSLRLRELLKVLFDFGHFNSDTVYGISLLTLNY